MEPLIIKGPQINEGKTKKIFSVTNQPYLVIFEYKNTITKFDDPSLTEEFQIKAESSTTTTCKVFELLKNKGLPVAYIEQLSPTEILMRNCQMIFLEVVARRYAVGSYLKRNPEFIINNGPPYRFPHLPVVEFFLKTTGGKLINKDGKILLEGLDPQQGEEDPLVIDYREPIWRLYHPKIPANNPAANLIKAIPAALVLGSEAMRKTFRIEELITKIFTVLEAAWEKFHCRLIDLKVEFGFDLETGRILIADTIDNDSWRLQDKNWQELSKESFRQGEPLAQVEEKYRIVAELAKKLC